MLWLVVKQTKVAFPSWGNFLLLMIGVASPLIALCIKPYHEFTTVTQIYYSNDRLKCFKIHLRSLEFGEGVKREELGWG